MEFAAAELGALQDTTTGGGSALMADALDLRHRLPQLWRQVLAGQVRSWRARKVTQATRHLSEEAAGYVDEAVAGFISSLSWSRFESLLQAKIVEADPADAEARARLWEAERFVRAGRSSQLGLKTLVARAAAGDVIWFVATVNRIAEILRRDGDLDPVDVRRSKAIGILAQPATALDLLWKHRDDCDNPGDPDNTEHLERIEDQRRWSTGWQKHSPSSGSEQDGCPDAEPDEAAELAQPVDDPEPADPEPADDAEPADGSELTDDAEPAAESVRLASLIVSPPKRGQVGLPPATLYVHLSQESVIGCGPSVARMEEAGPVTIDQVRRFLGERCSVRIQLSSTSLTRGRLTATRFRPGPGKRCICSPRRTCSRSGSTTAGRMTLTTRFPIWLRTRAGRPARRASATWGR